MVDSREADDKSVNMEKIGFTRAIDDVIAKSATPVTEVVTDQHSQIRALMSSLSIISKASTIIYFIQLLMCNLFLHLILQCVMHFSV